MWLIAFTYLQCSSGLVRFKCCCGYSLAPEQRNSHLLQLNSPIVTKLYRRNILIVKINKASSFTDRCLFASNDSNRVKWFPEVTEHACANNVLRHLLLLKYLCAGATLPPTVESKKMFMYASRRLTLWYRFTWSTVKVPPRLNQSF